MSSLGLPVEDTPIFVARVGEIFANLRDPAMSDKLVAALASIVPILRRARRPPQCAT